MDRSPFDARYQGRPEAIDWAFSMLWGKKKDGMDTCCGTSRAGWWRPPRLASHCVHLHCHTLGPVQDGALSLAAAQLHSMASNPSLRANQEHSQEHRFLVMALIILLLCTSHSGFAILLKSDATTTYGWNVNVAFQFLTNPACKCLMLIWKVQKQTHRLHRCRGSP